MADPLNLTDAELDEYVLTTLALNGVDLTVLPAEDSSALMDQATVLRLCRSRVRQNFEVLAYELDPKDHLAQYHLPTLYPSPQHYWTSAR